MGGPVTTTVLLEGRGFLEAPHWHDGELWMSDLHRHEVVAVTTDGDARVVGAIDDQPSGLGFLPDGTAIVTSLLKRRVVRVTDDSLYADLADLTVGGTNDMIVDARGRAYVGSFGYDVFGRAPKAPGNLVLVDGRRAPRVVAEELAFPNGMAITSDGTLVVAESAGGLLTAFDVEDDGSLSGRRLWAEIPGRPDGITIDIEDAIWVALPREGRCVRVERGGALTGTVFARDGWRTVSCGFGGADLSTLYVTTAFVTEPTATACLEYALVDVPGVPGDA
jgi:sugar lactone lactonase YvrE